MFVFFFLIFQVNLWEHKKYITNYLIEWDIV